MFNKLFSQSASDPAGESAIILTMTGPVFSDSASVRQRAKPGEPSDQDEERVAVAFGCIVNIVTLIWQVSSAGYTVP